MRRHPALQDLSRDHFVALNAVVDVRRVVEGDRHAKPAGEVRQAFLDLADGTLLDHFAEEEQLLLPLLDGDGRHGHAGRLRQDHERLRDGFGRAGQDLETLWEVAKDLREHVRWEEDDLFQSLQAWLTDKELDGLRTASDGFRRSHRLPIGPA